MVASRDTKHSLLFLAGLIAVVGLLQPVFLSSHTALAQPVGGKASASLGPVAALVRRSSPEGVGYTFLQRRQDGTPDTETPPSGGADSGDTPPAPTTDQPSSPPADSPSTDSGDTTKDLKGLPEQLKSGIEDIVNTAKEGSKEEAKEKTKQLAESTYQTYKGQISDDDIKKKIEDFAEKIKSKHQGSDN